MKQLQAEHKEWVDREYPNQPSWLPAAGMVEEAGELLHAVIKLEQLKLFGDDPRYSAEKLRAALADAIGDCGIYVCSFCNAAKWDFAECIERSSHVRSRSDAAPVKRAIDAVRYAAAFVDDNSMWNIALYLAAVRTVATIFAMDMERCIHATWDVVKQRRRKP